MSRSRFALSALAAMLLAVPSLQAVELQSVAGTDTKLKVYGFVEAYGTYWAKGEGSQSVNNSLFYGATPSAILDASAAPTNQFGMTVNTSRIGFATTTPSANFGDVTTKIEADFNGAPWHLRHAYISIGGLTVGQTWSTWNDLDAGADTVDWAGPVGAPCFDTPRFKQIRYSAQLDKKNNITVGLEQNNGYNDGASEISGAAATTTFVLDPTTGVTTKSASPASTGQADGKYPTLVGAYTYADTWGHVGLRALGQNVGAWVPATSTTSSYRYNKMAGAVMVSGNVNVGKDNLVASVYTGSGLGQYGTGFQAAVLNDATQTINLYKSTGWLLGYTHVWNDQVRSNLVGSGVTFSSDSALPATDSSTGSAIKTAYSVNVNTIVKLTKSTELGFEYVYESAKAFGVGQAKDTDGNATNSNSAGKFEISLTANF
jgi:hypothetical protein